MTHDELAAIRAHLLNLACPECKRAGRVWRCDPLHTNPDRVCLPTCGLRTCATCQGMGNPPVVVEALQLFGEIERLRTENTELRAVYAGLQTVVEAPRCAGCGRLENGPAGPCSICGAGV